MYEYMFENIRYEWKKIRVRECNDSECANETSGLQGVMAIPTRRQCYVLTNRCLGRERMPSEGLRNPSFLTGSDKLIVEDWGGNASRYPAAIAVADRSQLTSTHCAYPEAPKCWTHFPNDSGPMTSFFSLIKRVS